MRHLGTNIQKQRLQVVRKFLCARRPSPRACLAASVITLPETGASIMSAPFSRTLAARARLTSGLTVLMSMWNLPGRKAREQSIGALGDGGERSSIRDHRKGDIRGQSHGFRRIGKLHAPIDQPLRLRACPVVAGNGVPFFEQASNHVAAHHTETDKSKFRHSVIFLFRSVPNHDVRPD